MRFEMAALPMPDLELFFVREETPNQYPLMNDVG